MTIADRRDAFESAEELIAKIVEQHPLEPVKDLIAVFGPAHTTTTAEQRLSLTIDAANWLLET